MRFEAVMRRILKFVVVGCAAVAGAAGGMHGCGAVTRLPAAAPMSLERVPLQYGKGEIAPTTFVVSAGAWEEIAALFGGEGRSAEEERVAIGEAIGEFERIAGEQGPTWADRAGSNWPRVEGVGQMDCVDESTNTTNYLVLLEQRGLLRRHEVMTPVRRYKNIVGVHRTAVVREVETGELFAVDSWFRDNGRAAAVMPLGVWRTGREDPWETAWD